MERTVIDILISAIKKEFEANANNQQTEIHLDAEFGCVTPLATAAENVVGDNKVVQYDEFA